MIIVPSELLGDPDGNIHSRDLSFLPLDEGSVYNGLFNQGKPGSSPGTLYVGKPGQHLGPTAIGKPDDAVRVIAKPRRVKRDADRSPVGQPFTLHGYVLRNGHWLEMPVLVVAIGQELHSRSRGILETDVLEDAAVFQAGGGSGGAPIFIELAKAGVGHLGIMDHDRIEVGNVLRHAAELCDVGRHKTKFLAEAVLGKNPYAHVETWEEGISWDKEDLLRGIARRFDLGICAVDDPTAIVIMNRIFVEENKPLIIAGAFRRAYGGQILVVKPRVTPCYECFRRSLPEKALDLEISSAEQAERIAYSDRPVHIEPGLSNDIAPISTMAVKLALQVLLKDKPTTLRSLDEDLVAPWYLWLNRREPGTDYEKLEPLEFNLNGLHILGWCGIDLRRYQDCPCCGDFVGEAARTEGLNIRAEDAAEFAG